MGVPVLVHASRYRPPGLDRCPPACTTPNTLVTCLRPSFTVQLCDAEGVMGRTVGFIGTIVVMSVGIYIYSTQLKDASATGGGGTPAGTANVVGVKNDLISIANAERGYYATEQKYASLDELVSARYITIERQRPPYTYDIETTSSGFRVTATRDGAGGPAQFWIDETMQVQSSN